jgi:hypothetical protein
LDRRLRTTVPAANPVGLHVAEACGFTRVGTRSYAGQQVVVLEQSR